MVSNHTADNIETLAKQVVEDMELDDLLAYAVQQMEIIISMMKNHSLRIGT